MRVVGHRGAAGLAPENTISAIKAAIAAGVDVVEFDVRLTKDRKLVLIHDESLERTHGIDQKVSETKLKDLQNTKNQNGQSIPTLEEAIKACSKVHMFIEGKGSDWARPLATFIKKHHLQQDCSVISFNHRELFTFGLHCKNVKRYAVEHHNPFDAINAARLFGLEGIDLNYWILNPLAYWLAHRHKLDVAVYTVNKTWLASFLRVFYPRIGLTTDYPDRMQFVRPKEIRVKTVRRRKL